MQTCAFSHTAKWKVFRFFTIQSNLLAGVVSLLYAAYQLRMAKNQERTIPAWVQVVKLAATANVSLTLVIVLCFLAPLAAAGGNAPLGYWSLFLDGYLLYHFVVPVFSVITFLFLDAASEIKARHALFGLLPVSAYAVYYMVNVFTHLSNGKVSPEYDCYYFVQDGLWQAAVVFPLILGLSYVLCMLLWALNSYFSRRAENE